MSSSIYSLLADLLLITHAAFIGFIVIGLLLILTGGVRRWKWVRNLPFRLLHLAAIVVVVLQAWLGVICPLTTLEAWLREQAGQNALYGEAGFIAHWLHRLIFFSAPPWMFTVCYTAFGLLVLLSWIVIAPARKRSTARGQP
ncbi:MAG: DUF2784 domain-containing protein [Phycisphaeraceae bacterium]|nr:DUF2784 domain-containing protein [Phycisphaeraceae bacterium]